MLKSIPPSEVSSKQALFFPIIVSEATDLWLQCVLELKVLASDFTGVPGLVRCTPVSTE